MMRSVGSLLRGLAIISAVSVSAGVCAQTRDFTQLNSERVIDWYYATTFGTGVYQIADRTVVVGLLPFSYQLRASDEEHWGIKLKAPVTVGVFQIPNQLGDILSRDNFAMVSVLPGVEFERNIRPQWVIRPTASFGYGLDIGGAVGSRIWETGVRSLYTIPMRQGEFVLGNALLYAGNNTTTGTTQNLGILSTGLNFILPTGKELLGRPTNFGLHFIHYAYFNRLNFFLDSSERRRVDQQFEVAVTLGASKPFEIFGFSVDRIGVGFRIGSDFFAIRLVTGFLY